MLCKNTHSWRHGLRQIHEQSRDSEDGARTAGRVVPGSVELPVDVLALDPRAQPVLAAEHEARRTPPGRIVNCKQN
jgi:hypothetical protein